MRNLAGSKELVRKNGGSGNRSSAQRVYCGNGGMNRGFIVKKIFDKEVR